MNAGKKGELTLGLTNRHIQLMSIGGTIGTGLFLGTSGVLKMAGPLIILGYVICGIIIFFIIRQLGEMVVEEPVAGSFSHFAYKYCGDFAGFFSGWNYWFLSIFVGMFELIAIGKYMQYWYPYIPVWLTATCCFIVINIIHLINVKVFGETEFCFAIIKVLSILGVIIFGIYLLITGHAGPQASITNIFTDNCGCSPNCVSGLIKSLTIIILSFGGLELVGITAAETKNQKQVIPQAIRNVVYSMIVCYIGSLIIILSLYPCTGLLETITTSSDNYHKSPFVQIFSLIGYNLFANILNIVVLTAAVSVYNSYYYCNSRMLYGLARQGNAPKMLLLVNKRGIPLLSIGISALVTFLGIILNYILTDKVLDILISLVVSTLIINWAMISFSHLKFISIMKKNKVKTLFKSILSPFSNYLCLIFLFSILAVMLTIPEMKLSVYAIPFWIFLIWGCYMLKNNKNNNK